MNPLSNKIREAFLAIVVLQAVHSVEEFVFRLYEVFPPMVYLYRDSPHLARPAFIAFNVLLLIAGLACLFYWVWPGRQGARTVVWVWTAGEAFNAAAHSVWAIATQRYNPGLVTGLAFVPVLVYMTYLLRRGPAPKGAGA